MNRGLLNQVRDELCDLSEPELRKVLSVLARYRQRVSRISSDDTNAAQVPRRRKSFRALTAFGIWSDRTEIRDPVHFTTQLRRRMERGEENK